MDKKSILLAITGLFIFLTAFAQQSEDRKEYIEKKYTNSNKDVEIPEIVKEEVITKALRVVNLAEDGINIPFYNIIEMRDILLNNNK